MLRGGASRRLVAGLALGAIAAALAAAFAVGSILSAPLAHLLTPLLLWQVEPRLGFDPFALNPIDRIRELSTPLFVIAGSEDLHTTLAESRSLFAAASEPKELWVVQGAGHQSFHGFAPEEYEARVSAFFAAHLSPTQD